MKNGKLHFSNSLFKTAREATQKLMFTDTRIQVTALWKENVVDVNSVGKQNTGVSLQIGCLAGLPELVNPCRYVGMLVSV